MGEHPTHVSDVLCVEILQIQRRQRPAIGEHPTHVFYFRSVEILQPFYPLECVTIVKPLRGGGGTEISERSIEYHTRGGRIYLLACSCPSGEGLIPHTTLCLLDAPCRAGAGGAKCIVVEGERRLVLALCHIGLAGLRLRTQRSGEQKTNQCEEHRTTIT